jgi:hypothetical protein
VKKRKHHYVWEFYLRGWATNGQDQVWCQRAGKRFLVSTENIGHERDFYRLKEMSPHDLQVVETVIVAGMGEHLRPLARSWTPYFQRLFEFKRIHEESGKPNPELDDLLDTTINDLEEDLHASVEDRAVPILTALRAGDDSLLRTEEGGLLFVRFMAAQYLRTPGIKERVTKTLGEMPGFNAEAAFGLIRTMLSTSLGWSFYASRRRLHVTFLQASGDVTFVTGDQPAINTRGTQDPDVPPTNLELYYPLTPTLALSMNFDAEAALTERNTLSPEQVLAYNRQIANAADKQIYAQSEAALTALQQDK